MQKAIVIGATSGIGRGLAKILAQNNYKVGITGRRKEKLENLKNEKPNSYIVKTFDVTDTEKIVDHLNRLAIELDGLDLLIISSGTGDLNEKLDFEIEKRTMETNVTGFTCVANWAFNYFEAQRTGHLIGISSVGGIRGSRIAPAYSASKAYQINYLEGLRQKAKRLNTQIFVTDVRPGFVDTHMAKGEGQFWVSNVDKAANQIYQAIKSKSKVAFISKRWRMVAIILKKIPKVMYDRM